MIRFLILLGTSWVIVQAHGQQLSADDLSRIEDFEIDHLQGHWYKAAEPILLSFSQPKFMRISELKKMDPEYKGIFYEFILQENGQYVSNQEWQKPYVYDSKKRFLKFDVNPPGYTQRFRTFGVRSITQDRLILQKQIDGSSVVIYVFDRVKNQDHLRQEKWQEYFGTQSYKLSNSTNPGNIYKTLLIYQNGSSRHADVTYDVEKFRGTETQLANDKRMLSAFVIDDQLWTRRQFKNQERWVIMIKSGPISLYDVPVESGGFGRYYQKYDNPPVAAAGLILGFKKKGAKMTEDYEALSSKIAKKQKGYGLNQFEDIIDEYNEWVFKNDPEKHREYTLSFGGQD